MECVICNANIEDADTASQIFIRKYASRTKGTTVVTSYYDRKEICCKACHAKIKRIENLEFTLFIIAAILLTGSVFIMYNEPSSIDISVYICAILAIVLLLIAQYLSTRRVKINSFLKEDTGIPIIDEGGAVSFKKAKILIRSREQEYWWLM